MSPAPLLLLLSLAAASWAQQLPLYSYLGQPYCPQGQSLIRGRCWQSRGYSQYQPRWPERDPYEPQNIIEPSSPDVDCPEGYKKSRGRCSKLTDREIELDRLPKEPCPPGQRRSRLICRDYIN